MSDSFYTDDEDFDLHGLSPQITSRRGFRAWVGRILPGWLIRWIPRWIRHPRFSRLTARIIAINVLVLLIPVFGLFWANQYHDSLVKSEIELLKAEGNLIAVTIASAAVFANDAERVQLVPNKGRSLINLLTAESDTRVRLFGVDGTLLADSKQREFPGQVSVDPIEPGWREFWANTRDSWRRIFSPNRIGIPLYKDPADQFGDFFPEVREAYFGQVTSSVMQDERGELVLSVGLPIKRYRNVLGALMVTRDKTGIDDAIRDIRIKILQFFLIALLIMILLSFWLAGSIVSPVIALAKGADRVRNGKPYEHEIPDFSKRKDEIAELSLSLREMTHALWDRLDAIDSFAADVSHEIKNPLTSIKSALETTQMIKDPEKKAMLMDVALTDIGRLDRLITDISNASRLDAELNRGDSELVDIREMLTTLSESLNLTRRDGEAELVLRGLKSGTVFVRGIEGRLGQVLTNLISNAKSFSPENGKIALAVRRSRTGFVAISVEDEGPGIPKDKLDAVFNRFYTDRPESSFGNHSGLGLSISKQIATAHGGDLTAGNHYDANGKVRGAKFTLTLPIHSVGR